jgi:hypothetical protein
VLAIEEAPSEAVEDSGMGGGRERCFLDHATPGDVTGVDQIDVGEHLPPRRRADSVSGDEHVSPDLRTVGQVGGHAIMILGEAGQGDAAADAFLGESGGQHRVEPSPRGTELRHANFPGNAAVAGEGGAATDGDADAAVDLGTRGQQSLQHRGVYAEAGTPSLEPSLAPLDDDHVPPRAQEGVAREEATEGTADHDRAPHGDNPVREGERIQGTMRSINAARQAFPVSGGHAAGRLCFAAHLSKGSFNLHQTDRNFGAL